MKKLVLIVFIGILSLSAAYAQRGSRVKTVDVDAQVVREMFERDSLSGNELVVRQNTTPTARKVANRVVGLVRSFPNFKSTVVRVFRAITSGKVNDKQTKEIGTSFNVIGAINESDEVAQDVAEASLVNSLNTSATVAQVREVTENLTTTMLSSFKIRLDTKTKVTGFNPETFYNTFKQMIQTGYPKSFVSLSSGLSALFQTAAHLKYAVSGDNALDSALGSFTGAEQVKLSAVVAGCRI